MLCLPVPALACSIASFQQRGPVLSMVFCFKKGLGKNADKKKLLFL